MARTWGSLDRAGPEAGEESGKNEFISHSRTSITKLLWTLANTLGKCVLVIEEKKGEEMKKKRKEKPTTVMSR